MTRIVDCKVYGRNYYQCHSCKTIMRFPKTPDLTKYVDGKLVFFDSKECANIDVPGISKLSRS